MKNDRLYYLLNKYFEKKQTVEEKSELLTLLPYVENEEVIKKWIDDGFKYKLDHAMDDTTQQDILSAIVQVKPLQAASKYPVTVHRVHFLRTAWFRVAVVIVISFGIGLYFFLSTRIVEQPIVVAEQNKQPGSDKAVLTLSNGIKVVLSDISNENITDGNISIEKSNGVLNYNTGSITNNKKISYNTMSTPRGGQYQLVLPDGSKVWLNAASSLKYPTFFNEENRTVELSGEAYFDIKQNKKNPFIVKTQNAEVLVLGTEFNINSYSDEPEFSTTLINGSVKVSSGNTDRVISPGQQAQISYVTPDVLLVNNNVDVSRIIAWQKGIFEFKGVGLDVIARQLSRWYDLEIKVFNNKGKKLSGGITQKTPLKTVLKVLEANGVKYEWKNNYIILNAN
jgi:transmembrane sensor